METTIPTQTLSPRSTIQCLLSVEESIGGIQCMMATLATQLERIELKFKRQ